jgi:hypothetical protein
MTPKLTQNDLLQFTGSECLYRHPIARHMSYTQGARHLAERGGAYWLLNEIALAQSLPQLASEPFQTWTLTVAADRSAVLVADDGNRRVLMRKRILLPSEY